MLKVRIGNKRNIERQDKVLVRPCNWISIPSKWGRIKRKSSSSEERFKTAAQRNVLEQLGSVTRLIYVTNTCLILSNRHDPLTNLIDSRYITYTAKSTRPVNQSYGFNIYYLYCQIDTSRKSVLSTRRIYICYIVKSTQAVSQPCQLNSYMSNNSCETCARHY